MKYISCQIAGALRNDSHSELSSVSKNQIGKCYIGTAEKYLLNAVMHNEPCPMFSGSLNKEIFRKL